MKLTKTEKIALNIEPSDPFGEPDTVEELLAMAEAAYYVWDDAPMAYWVRAKPMKTLHNLILKNGGTLSYGA